ncbi:MAG: AsmA-like C-terminal region-containing protein, partial [Candidatus Scalindua sp.]|nr:AsmA-like C-terminal region-containing protein [Candidatus Scalindua sp.]
KNMREKTKKRWPMIVGISIGGVIGLIIIIISLIPTIVSSGMVKNKIINSIEAGLSRKVQIDDINMSWSSGLDIKNIHIREREDLPGDTFVKVKRILCNIEFVPLIKKQIRINDLIIDSPEIVIQRDKNGLFNYEDKSVSAESGSTPGSGPTPEKVEKPTPDVARKPAGKPVPAPLVIPALLSDLKIKAKVNNGKFTFIDHQLQEETRIKDLNTTLSIDSLSKPIELQSAFDIEAKGETEHADISLNVSLAKGGKIDPGNATGTFNMKTGFALITTDFDMAKFKGEGGTGLDFSMNVDLKKLTENLAGLLGLPKGMQVEGDINSKITAHGQLEKTIGVDGSTEIANLYITGGPLEMNPIRLSKIKLTQKADIDIKNDQIAVYKIGIDSAFLEMFLAGLVTELKSARDLNFKIFMDLDISKLMGEVGGLLPDETEIAGRLQSNMKLTGQQNIVKVNGKTDLKGLYVRMGAIGPIKEPEVTINHDMVYDLKNSDLELRSLSMNTGFAEIKGSGTVINNKKIDLNVLLSSNIRKLTQSLQGIVSLPEGLSLDGEIDAKMNVTGHAEKGLKLDGTTTLSSINATGGPLKNNTISGLGLKLLHTLDYNITKDSVNIEKMDIESDFLKMESKGGIADLSKQMNIDYGLSMEMELNKMADEFAGMFPVAINMSGKGVVGLDINGKLSVQENENIYEEMNLNGNMSMDRIIYDAYEMKNFKAGLSLDDGFFTTKDFSFVLNDGPCTVLASADLKEEKPPLIFDMKLSDANINQNMDILAYIAPVLAAPEGKLTGALNMQFKAKGNGLNWQNDLSKSLSGEGEIDIKDGYIRGGKVMSKVLKAIGGKREYEFEQIITRFVIEDSKIINDDINVNGKEFDIGFSGWTSFDGRIEYSADAEGLGSHLGGDAGKILGSFSEGSKLPIVVTGTIDRPRLSFKWSKPQEIGNILQGILGGSEDSKPQTGSSDSQEKTEAEDVAKETQPVKREEKDDLEDVVKDLFKGLFK